jgi:hypothetical protein
MTGPSTSVPKIQAETHLVDNRSGDRGQREDKSQCSRAPAVPRFAALTLNPVAATAKTAVEQICVTRLPSPGQ